MTLLSAMTEAETYLQRCFTRNVVKIIFILTLDYAALPEPKQFVYTMVTTLAEGRLDAVIPASNRSFDSNTYYPLHSEIPAVWSDISNAHQVFKDHSTYCVVLDEAMRLELSNFARLLKLKPGVNDDHVQQVAIDLWFRQVDYRETRRRA